MALEMLIRTHESGGSNLTYLQNFKRRLEDTEILDLAIVQEHIAHAVTKLGTHSLEAQAVFAVAASMKNIKTSLAHLIEVMMETPEAAGRWPVVEAIHRWS